MQNLIVFIIIYLYPSLGMCVFAWENLNLVSCFVCCPATTWVLLSSQVCVR